MIDIFRNDTRGCLWLDTAKNFEEAKSKAKVLYEKLPAEYFAFDLISQTRFVFTLEELGYQNEKKAT